MTTPVLAEPIDSYVAAFEAMGHAETPVPEAVRTMRRGAFDRFVALGFPTTKNEDWHYTSVAPITDREFTLVSGPVGTVSREQLEPFTFGLTNAHTAVFVNGRFAPELSRLGQLPRGVRVLSLAAGWTSEPELAARISTIVNGESHAFTALNTAFVHDGALVDIANGVEVAEPIHLVFVADAAAAMGMVHPRTLVSVGRQAKATVIESYIGLGDARYFTNAVSEVSLADGATLHHHKIQRESSRAFHVGTIEAHQARDSHYFSFSFAIGAELSRTNVYTTLDGSGGGATLNGLYMIDGAQHCDHQTQIIHAQPECYSRELYKGILDGTSHGVFNGKVYVHPIAQKTDGKQTNKTLLLSDKARVDAKPQLEIFADDVKCTHGATVGQIDQLALFYMKSRGVNAETARKLLTYAFAADVLETIELPAVREALEHLTLERYAGS